MKGYSRIEEGTSTDVAVLPKSRSLGGLLGQRFARKPGEEEKRVGVVGRTFSVRRMSSTVADVYWRVNEEEDEGVEERKRGRIMRACRRLFGISR